MAARSMPTDGAGAAGFTGALGAVFAAGGGGAGVCEQAAMPQTMAAASRVLACMTALRMMETA
jgi:hypothetical protein